MKSWMTMIGSALALSCSAAVTMSKVGETSFSVNGCGGITYLGGNQFYVLRDHNDESPKRAEVYPMTLNYNESNGEIASYSLDTPFNPGTFADAEGIAYDPGSGTFWVSDESTPSIKEFYPIGSATGRIAPVPSVQSNKRSNLSLESLTISGDGLTMWTANEQALNGDGDVTDDSSSKTTVVRLTKFTRATLDGNWVAAGQWPYTVDKCAAPTSSQSGLSGLCALPDGSLLALEREVSTSTWGRCRVYRVTESAISSATEISTTPSLQGTSYTSVSKGNPLIDFQEGGGLLGDHDMIIYEGICLGPRLSNGDLTVYLVSDGGATKSALGGIVSATARARLCACKLSGLNVRTLNFPAPAQGTATITGSNFRYLNGATVVNTLSGVESEAEPEWGAYDAIGAEKSWSTVGWSVSGESPANGSGNQATFTVAGDGEMSWSVETQMKVNSTSQIFASDSFEQPAVGTTAGALAGWTGDGTVRAQTYTPPMPPGYPMAHEAHTQVLEVDDMARRSYSSQNGNSRLEMMVCVSPAAEGLESPDNDVQIAVAADRQGRLCVRHCVAAGNTWTPRWTVLSETAWSAGSWVRIEFLNDYTSSTNGRAYCQIRVNGSLCPTEYGVRSPKDLTPYGSWYAMVGGGLAGKISSVTFEGSTKVDDLIFSQVARASEHAGATSVDGIEFSWFDGLGFARDPSAPAPFIPGYTLADVYVSGVDPYGEEPLKIKAIRMGADGRVELDVNACRPNPETVYCVYRSATLEDRKTAEDVAGGAANFTTDAENWTTTWTDDSGETPSAFYWIKAVRSKAK